MLSVIHKLLNVHHGVGIAPGDHARLGGLAHQGALAAGLRQREGRGLAKGAALHSPCALLCRHEIKQRQEECDLVQLKQVNPTPWPKCLPCLAPTRLPRQVGSWLHDQSSNKCSTAIFRTFSSFLVAHTDILLALFAMTANFAPLLMLLMGSLLVGILRKTTHFSFSF